MNSPGDSRIYTLDFPREKSINFKYGTTIIYDRIMNKSVKMENLCFEYTNYEDKISCPFGGSATFDFSPYYKKVDIFFIDGSHSYEYVRLDTLKTLKCCHSGSVIAWQNFGRMCVNWGNKVFDRNFAKRIYHIFCSRWVVSIYFIKQ